jgi:hypothetical protein
MAGDKLATGDEVIDGGTMPEAQTVSRFLDGEGFRGNDRQIRCAVPTGWGLRWNGGGHASAGVDGRSEPSAAVTAGPNRRAARGADSPGQCGCPATREPVALVESGGCLPLTLGVNALVGPPRYVQLATAAGEDGRLQERSMHRIDRVTAAE